MMCFGRIRKSFREHFILSLIWETPNQTLPEGHTWYIIYIYIYIYISFFQFDLPKYTNTKIMKEKILYAITFCQVIDTDGDYLVLVEDIFF